MGLFRGVAADWGGWGRRSCGLARKRDDLSPRDGVLCSREGLLGTGKGLSDPRAGEALTPGQGCCAPGKGCSAPGGAARPPARPGKRCRLGEQPRCPPAPVASGTARPAPPHRHRDSPVCGQGWTSRAWERGGRGKENDGK